MASLLNAVRQLNYIGAPQAVPTALCTPPTQKPMNVPINIDWTIYFTVAANAPASLGVNVDLSGNSPNASKLDAIRSVKIDNTASYCTIYVWFTDTDDVVTCAPQTVTTMPVNTNQQKFVVIASGLLIGFLPITKVYVYNVQLPPSVDPALQLTYPQWIGSPTIQRNANQILTPGYGSPALGDICAYYPMDVAVARPPNLPVPIWGSPYSSGSLYVTSMLLNGTILINSISNAYCAVRLYGQVSGQIALLVFGVTPTVQPYVTILNQTGLNIRLDATDSYFMTSGLSNSSGVVFNQPGVVTNGTVGFFTSFSQNNRV